MLFADRAIYQPYCHYQKRAYTSGKGADCADGRNRSRKIHHHRFDRSYHGQALTVSFCVQGKKKRPYRRFFPISETMSGKRQERLASSRRTGRCFYSATSQQAAAPRPASTDERSRSPSCGKSQEGLSGSMDSTQLGSCSRRTAVFPFSMRLRTAPLKRRHTPSYTMPPPKQSAAFPQSCGTSRRRQGPSSF